MQLCTEAEESRRKGTQLISSAMKRAASLYSPLGTYAAAENLEHKLETGDARAVDYLYLGLGINEQRRLILPQNMGQPLCTDSAACYSLWGGAPIRGADDIAFMGKGNWEYVPDLTHVTGKTAASRNRAIQALIKEDLSDLRLTHQPEYSPFIPRGLAKKDMGTQLGYKSFSSRNDLRRVIVHEELHHRWFKRGIPGSEHHASDFVPDEKFYRVIERYFKMRGWE